MRKSQIGGGLYLDNDGNLVSQRGYLVNESGDVVDKRGNVVFLKESLDEFGDIPKVFRAGLLRADSFSDLSRVLSEIENSDIYENDRFDRR